MAAFFADVKEKPISQPEPELMLPTEAQQKQLKRASGFAACGEQSGRADTAPTPQLDGATLGTRREASMQRASVPWTSLTPTSAMSTEGATLAIQKDGSILASGANPDKDKYVVAMNTTVKGITAIRIEALPDTSFAASRPAASAEWKFCFVVDLIAGQPRRWRGGCDRR